MKLLLTADWQCDFECLDLCERAADEVLELCHANDLYGIVVAGDLKRAYNPVDIRVARFWMDFIATAKHEVGKFIIVLGNHDRVGMYTEAQNWLPILERAGADIVHNKPKRISIQSGSLYCLPFTSNVDVTKKWAKNLAESVPNDETQSVLIFHNDVLGCSYNVLGHKSSAKLRYEDLQPHKYDYCFGGHVHQRQLLGTNGWYIGNPFATDWGEANQRKGYMILKRDGLKFEPSKIPGWYDPSWPRCPKDKTDWDGARVRIHVPIEVGQNYSIALEQARKEAEKRYAGATIYTVPEFKEAKTAEIKIRLTDPDSAKIKAYVRETVPDILWEREKAIRSYLSYKLEKASQQLGVRTGGRIEFLWAKGKRFLSFDDLHVDFSAPGICMVVAKNKDWLGRSNGGGKTNYLSIVPVALFGRTFKGQKHDGWAQRLTEKRAEAIVKFRDPNGRAVKVLRSRRPGALQLFVDGKEQSSGLQSTSQTGTQGLIERLSGFTWQTLANAVYIDQQQVNNFLGTPGEQKKILERFQNLERFAQAFELIKSDVTAKEKAISEAENERSIAEAQVRAYKDVVGKAKPPFELEEAHERLRAARERQNKVNDKVAEARKDIARRIDKILKTLTEVRSEYDAFIQKSGDARTRLGILEDKIGGVAGIITGAQCPMCLQPVNKNLLHTHIANWQDEVASLKKKKKRFTEAAGELHDECNKLLVRKLHLEELEVDYVAQKARAKEHMTDCLNAVSVAKDYWAAEQDRQRDLKKKIANALRQKKFWIDQLAILKDEKVMLDYCAKAFSRNGVPAFLNAQACPALNKAAEHYSEVFTNKEIQVRFKMVESDFDVEIINAHGGEALVDQSIGEKKMAAIIASFAARRAIAPPCNLLVLDEPGDGLDAANAKAFATGLKSMKHELGTVLLTTHNSVIQGELSGESLVTIVKQGGVSHVC